MLRGMVHGQVSAQRVAHQHRRRRQTAVSQLRHHRVEIAEERLKEYRPAAEARP
jgi:hypothetical protein